MEKSKILFLDIETKPSMYYIWSLFNEITSTEMQIEEWGILCVCAKWFKSKEVMSFALPDYPLYKKEPDNDIEVLKAIHKVLDEAEIVIGHNLAAFDAKKLNARFIAHGIKPPSPYKIVDTCLAARKHFAFISNKLNDIAKFLKIGQKKHTGGFSLWRRCMHGDLSAWKTMVDYCKQDVRLTEKVYVKLLPYITNHPNMAVYMDTDNPTCPNCGSHKISKKGFAYTTIGKYQRTVCNNCGKWSKFRENLNKKQQIKLV